MPVEMTCPRHRTGRGSPTFTETTLITIISPPRPVGASGAAGETARCGHRRHHGHQQVSERGGDVMGLGNGALARARDIWVKQRRLETNLGDIGDPAEAQPVIESSTVGSDARPTSGFLIDPCPLVAVIPQGGNHAAIDDQGGAIHEVGLATR
jgi:hypothetical protein